MLLPHTLLSWIRSTLSRKRYPAKSYPGIPKRKASTSYILTASPALKQLSHQSYLSPFPTVLMNSSNSTRDLIRKLPLGTTVPDNFSPDLRSYILRKDTRYVYLRNSAGDVRRVGYSLLATMLYGI